MLYIYANKQTNKQTNKHAQTQNIEHKTRTRRGRFDAGVEFYSRGTKLFGDDVQYAAGLILKAAKPVGGVALRPREVRTLRRTTKDFATVIPFIVILIIPLTPVGHVFVFSFIQRFFPDFFPSPFTERRQNLMKMYEAIEKKDAEVLGGANGQDTARDRPPEPRLFFCGYVLSRGETDAHTIDPDSRRTHRRSRSQVRDLLVAVAVTAAVVVGIVGDLEA